MNFVVRKNNLPHFNLKINTYVKRMKKIPTLLGGYFLII